MKTLSPVRQELFTPFAQSEHDSPDLRRRQLIKVKQRTRPEDIAPEVVLQLTLSLLFASLHSSFAMSKTAVRKLHWRSKVLDTFVPLLDPSGEPGVAIGGGADFGEFPFVTSAPGGGLTVGDIILEIGGTPVLGMTLGDVRGVLNSCPHPIRAKTVSPGTTIVLMEE